MHESLKLTTGVRVTRNSTKRRLYYALSLSLFPSWSHSTLALTPYYTIAPIFKGQAVKKIGLLEPWIAGSLKMGPIGCPETSVTTNLHWVISQMNEDLIYQAAEA